MNVTSNRAECFFRWWGDRAEDTRLTVRIGLDGFAGRLLENGKAFPLFIGQPETSAKTTKMSLSREH